MIAQKKSLADIVAEQLSQQIAEGKYPVGEKLPTEPELMQLFQVGRSSIREAIKLLVNQQIVIVRQGAGTFVAEPTDDANLSINVGDAHRWEVDEVRRILELAIVEKAVGRRTDKDIARMQACLAARKEHAKGGELKACIEADLGFHIALADATHNPTLADIFRAASKHLLSEFERRYEDTACFVASQTSHEKLLKHIVAGDLKQARKMATRIVEEP